MDNHEKLMQAAALAEDVIATLDRGEALCLHCDTRSYANWGQELMARQLEAMALKLKSYANGKLFARAR